MTLGNPNSDRRVTFALIFLGLLLFAASFNDPFHYDDVLLLDDANVTHPGRWYHFLNPLHLRQLTFFTFYLNYLFGGDNPIGYHVVNLVLHIGNSLLLFGLLGRFIERWTAAAAAFVFLVHPVQTESVLYIYQRSVLLAAFLSLLALGAMAERRYWVGGILFVLAFEAKESALAVPLVILIFSGFRAPFTKTLLAFVAAFGAGALALLFLWQEETVGIAALDSVSPASYFLTETRVVYTYLRLLFVPYPLSLEYEFVPIRSIDWRVIVAMLGLVGLIGGAWWLSKTEQWRISGLAMLAFFMLLAPTSSIIPSHDFAFEHRLYLPMIGFSVFAASVAAKVPYRSAVLIVWLPVLSILTVQRGQVWSSDLALWEDAVQKAPGKARAWFNLGGAYMKSDPEKARAAFLRAIELQPHSPEAFYNLGVIDQRKGNTIAALGWYQRAVEQRPDYWPAWNNMGNTVFALKQYEKAIEYFNHTLNLNRDYWPAQYNLAVVYFTTGRFREAIPRLRTVLDWRPEFGEARYLLAVSLTQAGFRDEAEKEWQRLGGSRRQVPPGALKTIPAPVLR